MQSLNLTVPAPRATRADQRLALALLVTLSAFACGGAAGDVDNPGSAGTSQAGSSAGGTSGSSSGGAGGSSGSVNSAGKGAAAGAGGEGGSAGVAGNAAAGSGTGQACGDRTCGVNQYCRAPCSGTGFGGSQSLAKPHCDVLPTGCNGVPSCACICGETSFFCSPGALEVQCGCP
jgi:hypothetical protein